ncbi:hypothetical protein B0H11DRAFT_1822468 [Mycena galericulata]|nr:hypothetical protein B0H11DRAFT_1822468 [Mycena galericulata]
MLRAPMAEYRLQCGVRGAEPLPCVGGVLSRSPGAEGAWEAHDNQVRASVYVRRVVSVVCVRELCAFPDATPDARRPGPSTPCLFPCSFRANVRCLVGGGKGCGWGVVCVVRCPSSVFRRTLSVAHHVVGSAPRHPLRPSNDTNRFRNRALLDPPTPRYLPCVMSSLALFFFLCFSLHLFLSFFRPLSSPFPLIPAFLMSFVFYVLFGGALRQLKAVT